jgi:hypothetical protein
MDRLTSESEIYGIFIKSEQVKRELFRVLTEENALKRDEKWSAKTSAINCGSIIILFTNFNLGNRLIIPFKFRNIFPKVLWLGPQIIKFLSNPVQPICLNSRFDQFTL